MSDVDIIKYIPYSVAHDESIKRKLWFVDFNKVNNKLIECPYCKGKVVVCGERIDLGQGYECIGFWCECTVCHSHMHKVINTGNPGSLDIKYELLDIYYRTRHKVDDVLYQLISDWNDRISITEYKVHKTFSYLEWQEIEKILTEHGYYKASDEDKLISYKPLFKLLIDKRINKSDLVRKAGISSSTVVKMGKPSKKLVSKSVIEKICEALDCSPEDIYEYI